MFVDVGGENVESLWDICMVLDHEDGVSGQTRHNWPWHPENERATTRQRWTVPAWDHHWDKPTHPFPRPGPSYCFQQYTLQFSGHPPRNCENPSKKDKSMKGEDMAPLQRIKNFSFSIHPNLVIFYFINYVISKPNVRSPTIRAVTNGPYQFIDISGGGDCIYYMFLSYYVALCNVLFLYFLIFSCLILCFLHQVIR